MSFCLIWPWWLGIMWIMSGCISAQASEGVCHWAAICTRFSGRLNPLTPPFLIKITLGVISQKIWGWGGQRERGRGKWTEVQRGEEEFDLISAARVSFFCTDETENWPISLAKSLIGNLVSQHQYYFPLLCIRIHISTIKLLIFLRRHIWFSRCICKKRGSNVNMTSFFWETGEGWRERGTKTSFVLTRGALVR